MDESRNILDQMGAYVIKTRKSPFRNSIIDIICEQCKDIQEITIAAVIKQRKNGNQHYICKKCAGRKSWSSAKRKIAADRTRKQWEDPSFSGTIIGKAIARRITDD